MWGRCLLLSPSLFILPSPTLPHSFIKHLLSIYYVSCTALNSGEYSMNKILPGTYGLVWEADKHKATPITFSVSQHIYTYAFHGWLLFSFRSQLKHFHLKRALTIQSKKRSPPYDSHFLSSDLISFPSLYRCLKLSCLYLSPCTRHVGSNSRILLILLSTGPSVSRIVAHRRCIRTCWINKSVTESWLQFCRHWCSALSELSSVPHWILPRALCTDYNHPHFTHCGN